MMKPVQAMTRASAPASTQPDANAAADSPNSSGPLVYRRRRVWLGSGSNVRRLPHDDRCERSQLTTVGVRHTFETYEGDHTNRVVERIEMKVLPFFSQQLSFGKSTRATGTR